VCFALVFIRNQQLEKALGFSNGKELKGGFFYKFRQLAPGSPARSCCEFSIAGNLKYQNWMFF